MIAAKVSVQQLIANPDRIIDLADEAKDLAYHHGIIMRTHDTPNSSEVVTYVPFTLFPSPLPKAAFFQALAVQTHFNTLVDKISQDPDFLEEALAGTIQADDFTAKLFGIYRQVQREGRTQSIVVGLNRSDYMVDQMKDGTSSLKQIEINTIAAGGFGPCDHLPVVHRHTLRSVGLLEESERLLGSTSGTAGMCAALIKGWELYGQQKAVILFLVEDVQISKLSHRCLERELWKRNIPFIRKKFGEVSSRASLDDDKKLFINGLEVAVVYYRYGYRPDHYTEQAWDARLLMERSRAVKCPDISNHLAGTKKVQQVLARPGVLEKFFPDQPQVVEQIRATFTGLYTLDMGPEGDKTVEMALAAPDQFVLKPQREGGGNNIYGSDICQVLQRVKGSTERMAYILMDKIHPAPVQNYLLRRDAPLQITDCLSELGVLGAYVSGTLLWNLPEVLSFHWKYDTAGCCVLPFTSVMMAMKELLQGLITDPDRLKNLADEAKELALRHGIIIRTHENPNSSEVVTYVPFTLFPSPLPKTAFHQALALQTHFNTLVDKISQDPDFLGEALAGTIQADDFTARLFDIYRQVQQEDQTQSIVVGLTRSDYMVEDGTSSLELLEINTVAVSAYATSASLPVVHRHILRSVGLLEESERLLDTTNRTAGMCAALAKGWELYGQQKAVILFLVEEVQISRFNHRCMERELQRRNIPFIRRKFAEVSSRASLDDDKKLFIDGLEVAVVYYRYGYMPDHYTEQDWDTRLLMERSQAAKCPDISTHLAGTKKIQQVLARPGVLEKFFPDQPQVVEQIRATFTGLYTLDTGPEGDKTVEMALAAPDRFVLKPQREGGGNNIYGSEICQVLQRVKGSTERMAYILMDKIHPAPVQNYLLRRDAPLQITNCLSELGVLGAYVRQGKDMVMNECAGHLMKTKSSEHSDGGVAAGVAVLDNPLLF